MLLFATHPLPSLSRLNTNFTSPVCRLLCTPSAQEQDAPPLSSEFAVEYLINSCGLSSDRAIRAARRLPQLKSPEKSDAVLQFLRQAGISEPHIRAAILRDPAFLRFNVENCLKPRMAELLEMGFSPSHVSILLSMCPMVFAHTTLQRKIQFWIQILGSVEELLLAVKGNLALLSINPENSALPNLSFLLHECSLSARQIVRIMQRAPRLITYKPEVFKMKVECAEKLGVARSSGAFMYALIIVSNLNQRTIDARLNNLKRLGLSEEEVASLVSRQPFVLRTSEEMMGRRIEFLIKEIGYDTQYLVKSTFLFTLSLEKRLILRNYVRKLLKSKGHASEYNAFASFVKPAEALFVKKFVLPYESAIPGLYQAYTDARAGKIGGLEWFKSFTN